MTRFDLYCVAQADQGAESCSPKGSDHQSSAVLNFLLHTTHLSLCPFQLCSLNIIQLQILKVLLEGLYDDPDTGSKLGKLRMPNDVSSPVMEMIWAKVTEEWQVLLAPSINCILFVTIF